MKTYRCCYQDENSRIVATQWLKCADDEQVRAKVKAQLRANDWAAADVWEGPRIVARLSRRPGRDLV